MTAAAAGGQHPLDTCQRCGRRRATDWVKLADAPGSVCIHCFTDAERRKREQEKLLMGLFDATFEASRRGAI